MAECRSVKMAERVAKTLQHRIKYGTQEDWLARRLLIINKWKCFEHVCPCILICRSLSQSKCNNGNKKIHIHKHTSQIVMRLQCDLLQISVQNPSFCHVIHFENKIISLRLFAAFSLIGFLLVAKSCAHPIQSYANRTGNVICIQLHEKLWPWYKCSDRDMANSNQLYQLRSYRGFFSMPFILSST